MGSLQGVAVAIARQFGRQASGCLHLSSAVRSHKTAQRVLVAVSATGSPLAALLGAAAETTNGALTAAGLPLVASDDDCRVQPNPAASSATTTTRFAVSPMSGTI